MNIEMIKNIDDLIVFMDEEAKRWGRENYSQASVNGKGIALQWSNRNKYPCAISYMVGTIDSEDSSDPGRTMFELKAMWFNEEGNVTERPEFNND